MEPQTILQALFDEIKKDKIKVYSILTIPLDAVLLNKEIIYSGSYLFVLDMPTGMTTCQVRFNDYSQDAVDLMKQRVITTPFTRLYFNTSAVAGGILKLAIGVLSETFDIKDFSTTISLALPATPVINNTVCNVAGTEYSVAAPAHCDQFTIKARGGALKVCFTAAGSGTTYISLSDGQSWTEINIDFSGTLYFQSPTAGCVAETVFWT
jgi:hypothetical protein